MSIGSIVNKKVGVKQIIVGAGSSEAELETWVDAAANGQWVKAIPRQKGVDGFFPSSAEQERTVRIDAAPGITMYCSSVNEITGWTRAGGGGASPGVAPQPAANPPTGGGNSPQSGGQQESGGGGEESGGGGEESGGGGEHSGGGESESNYAHSYRARRRSRVNNYKSYRVSYY